MPLGLFGISMDISELKETQKRLYVSEQRLSTILDNVGAYIFIKDKERRFQYVNKQTEALFQLPQDEIIGKNNFDLLGEVQGRRLTVPTGKSLKPENGLIALNRLPRLMRFTITGR
nr:PAS domain S-box protein [Aliamphritea spongicola]